MKKIIIFLVIAICAGLHVNVYFASQQPPAKKGFLDKSFREHVQGFREWISKMYEKNAPSAEKTAIGAAGTATVFGKVAPMTSIGHATGGYMAYQGIKQAWQAISNGSISSSLAAGPLLVLGLGFSVMPTLKAFDALDTEQNNIAQKGQTAILALGLGVTAAGIISSVYHNLVAPINNGEIPKTAEVDKTLKEVTKKLIKAAADDDIAFPTRSAQINAFLKRKDFLKGDDTDTVVLEVCNDLIGEITEEFNKKSKEEQLAQNKEDKKIDDEIDSIREVMTSTDIVDPIAQINFLTEEIKKFDPYQRAIISLHNRLRNRLAIDLANGAQGLQKNSKPVEK